MSNNRKWLAGVLIVVLILAAGMLFILAAAALLLRGEGVELASFSDRVGIMELKGVIEESETFNRQLKTFREDENIRAVVVRIESPGGSVAPSQEIYQQLCRLRDETDKPVVAYLGAIAASGGYYVACAADSIVAAPGTLTGSIGVILEFPNLQEVLRKVGIGFEVVKSGEHKDIGSPWRSLTEEERRILQEMVDDVYGQFVELVSRERGLSADSVLALADGRVFSGRQAKKLGLVDTTGVFQDALDLAGRMCGLGDNPKTVAARKRQPAWYERLAESASRISEPSSALGSPRLMYIFR
ncbi:MAG: signal peptide peptidase SppA [Candidatus Glassbacteria bacterium]|nr:signal peptide peptidase SppA [Candidatus Glassbacteria bacterium]